MSADQKGKGDKIPEKKYEITTSEGALPKEFKNQGKAKKPKRKRFPSGSRKGQTTLIFSTRLPELSHSGELFASSHDLTCTEHPKDKSANDESGGKSKKAVHFADSKGQNLTEVRLYRKNTKPPEPPTSLLSNLKIDPEEKCAKTEKTTGKMSKKSPDEKRSGREEVLELYETLIRYTGKSHTETKKESTCNLVETPKDNISKEVLWTERPPTTLKRNPTPKKVVADDSFIPRSDLAFEKAPLLKADPQNSGRREEEIPISALHPNEFSMPVPGLCWGNEKDNNSNNDVSKVKLDTEEPNSNSLLTFVPLFKVRIPDVKAKLKKQKVILEDLVVTEKFLYGYVRTVNIGNTKEVYVRYSADDYETFREFSAEFKPEFSNLSEDAYSFSINLPEKKKGASIKFYMKFGYHSGYLYRLHISEEYVLQCVSVQGGKN